MGLEFNMKYQTPHKPPPAQGKVPAIIPKIPTNQSPCQSITPIDPIPRRSQEQLNSQLRTPQGALAHIDPQNEQRSLSQAN